MTVDTIAARNETIRELRAEIERLKGVRKGMRVGTGEAVPLAVANELRERAEAAEARVAELEQEIKHQKALTDGYRQKVDSAEADSTEIALRCKSKIAHADRLAEVVRAFIADGYYGIESVTEALAAYEAGEPTPDPYSFTREQMEKFARMDEAGFPGFIGPTDPESDRIADEAFSKVVRESDDREQIEEAIADDPLQRAQDQARNLLDLLFAPPVAEPLRDAAESAAAPVCPDCGASAKTMDEDGCCLPCGAAIPGYGADGAEAEPDWSVNLRRLEEFLSAGHREVAAGHARAARELLVGFKAEREELRDALREICSMMWHGNIDGGDVQNALERRGLLVEVPASEEVRSEYECETMLALRWAASDD